MEDGEAGSVGVHGPDGAAAVGPPVAGGAVEDVGAVEGEGAEGGSSVGVRVEGSEDGVAGSVGLDLEDGPRAVGAAARRDAVELAVVARGGAGRRGRPRRCCRPGRRAAPGCAGERGRGAVVWAGEVVGAAPAAPPSPRVSPSAPRRQSLAPGPCPAGCVMGLLWRCDYRENFMVSFSKPSARRLRVVPVRACVSCLRAGPGTIEVRPALPLLSAEARAKKGARRPAPPSGPFSGTLAGVF